MVVKKKNVRINFNIIRREGAVKAAAIYSKNTDGRQYARNIRMNLKR